MRKGGSGWRRWVLISSVAVHGVAGPMAHAADAGAGGSNAVSMAEIVVTATRTGEAPRDLPFVTSTLDARQLQSRTLARTTPEALREEPAVMVQKTAHGQGSPYIRGFTGFRTLFLVDGIRLNNSTYRDGPNQYWSTVDPFAIDRMELVKGPGSVLYGSDAVGGTVNALSGSPLARGDGRPAGGRAYYRFGAAEASHVLRGEGWWRHGEAAGSQLGISLKRFGDVTAGGATGKQPKTGYDERAVDAKAEWGIAPGLLLRMAHQSVIQEDVWRTHRTIYGRSFHGTTVGEDRRLSTEQDRMLTYAALEGVDVASWLDGATLTLSHQRQGEEQLRVRKDGASDRQGFDVNTVGVALQAVQATASGTWTYGVEAYRDFVDSFSRKYTASGELASVGVQGPVADDASYDTAGLYAQYRQIHSERVETLVGLRYNHLSADAGRFQDPVSGEAQSLSQDWDAVVGSLRGLYRILPGGGLQAFAGVSQAFRAPNLSDLTRLDVARSNELETPSPDLDSERFVAFEAGLRLESGATLLEGAYFHTDMEDLIVRAPTGRRVGEYDEVAKRNAGDGYVQGVEVRARIDFAQGWRWWGQAAWMEGAVDGYPTSSPEKVREPLSRVMPVTVHTGVRFAPGERWWVEGLVSAAAKQDKLSSADRADTQRIPPGGTPDYGVVSMRGGWTVSEACRLHAALENVFDKDYRIHGSGVNEPGRNLVLAVDLLF